MEQSLLGAIFHSREAFDELATFLSREDFSDKGQILFDQIAQYYEADPQAKKVETSLLLPRLERTFPKHFDMFKHIVERLEPSSTPNLKQEILEQKRHVTAMKLSSALLENKRTDIRDLIEMYQAYEAGALETEDEREIFIGRKVSDIVQAVAPDKLIRVYPLSLNQQLEGGVPPQTHMVVYATPEAGKSLFSINMAAGMCKDGNRVLYVGNEDPAVQMMLRFLSRMSGLNKTDILKNPAEAEARAMDKGYENLIFTGVAEGTISEIEYLIHEYRPAALIVDQIRHLRFPGVTGEVEQLTRAGKAMRRLGKKENLVVLSVTQAADSASNKLVLDQGDVYMSNTSLPGDADILIGIGMNKEYEAMNKRMLSPCKNKISGNHDPIPVAIDKPLNKVISI